MTFQAFYVSKDENGFAAGFRELELDDLPAGEVLIKVAFSSVNYKDGLATLPNGAVVRKYPIVPGIDLSGTVVDSSDSRFSAGDKVLATGYELGQTHWGGYGEYACVKADWVLKLPENLSLKHAMTLGTAGVTAGLSLLQMERMGLRPENGPVLVTGGTGGVSTVAIAMLAKAGYMVAASTGKADQHDFLKQLGASEILSRDEVSTESNRAMDKERWAGSVDSVGGTTLAYLLRTTKAHGSIASCGLTGGTELKATVFPFLLRGVNVLGIDSAYVSMHIREQLWQRMATDFSTGEALDLIAQEVELAQIPEVTARILKGGVSGRTVVRVGGE